MREIHITEVQNKEDFNEFINLPYKIHKKRKNWLPPLISDEKKLFDKDKNHNFKDCDTLLLVAKENNIVIGRIMGIISKIYNNGHNENCVRFCFLECYDDKEVFDLLINKIENWGKQKGMTEIVGPLGFSDKDPQGFLIEGFDDPITVMITNCSAQYMPQFMDQNKYQKKVDLFQYRLNIPKEIPEIYLKVFDRIKNRGFNLLEFKKIKDIQKYIKDVFELINETYIEVYGFSPLNEIEMYEFSNRFLPLMNPRFIKIITNKEDKVLGFIVAMPDISRGLKKANGKLFPFGFIHVLKELKFSKQLNLLLGCVKSEYQNLGLFTLLSLPTIQEAIKKKMKIIDSHLILEDNIKMRAEIERFNGQVYKKYRIYKKDL